MKNDETQINYQNIDYELTIKRGLNICEQNKTALQNRYQLLHSSAVRSASMYSDMPHSPNSGSRSNEQKLLEMVMKETDSLSNYMTLFRKMAQTRKTHNEGYFLYKYYVMGVGKETIFDELEIKSDKRKRKAVQENAYLLVAMATNSVAYKTNTIITFKLD